MNRLLERPDGAAHPSAPAASASESSRLASLDLLRGAVMILMALDHVRWFLGAGHVDPTDLDRASTGLFFTRWITHFCAPVFVFLAGAGARLRLGSSGDRAGLARFLLVRGAWLVLLEATLVRLGWTFNLDYGTFLFFGVIAAIGAGMLLLALLALLRAPVVAAIGLAIVCFHGALAAAFGDTQGDGRGTLGFAVMKIAYFGGAIRLADGGPFLVVLFSVLPWFGVMACGFGFGALLQRTLHDRRARDRWCLALGAAATLAFIALRAAGWGDPEPWDSEAAHGHSFLALLNASKYPPSTCFLLMTLGPAVALLPLLDRARGAAARFVTIFGRVPLFFYLLHLPAIHGLAVLVSLARHGEVVPWLTANHPLFAGRSPDGWGLSLPVVWLWTAVVVAALYFPCAWFARLRARRKEAWLSFL